MPKVSSSGVEISYDDLGTGEPALLLMPGWCGNKTVFSEVIREFARHRRTLAIDWRGHGQSGHAPKDFGDAELVEDAIAVIKASKVDSVVPVATAHAGWIAIELAENIKKNVGKIVLLDWIVTEAPAPFLSALEGMQSKEHWRETVDALFDSWLQEVENHKITHFVRDEMGAYGFEMWARAAREITKEYRRHSSPLKRLSSLQPPNAVLHLYAQPDDPEYLKLQERYSEENPWFQVEKLKAKTHMPTLEAPGAVVQRIERFLA